MLEFDRKSAARQFFQLMGQVEKLKDECKGLVRKTIQDSGLGPSFLSVAYCYTPNVC